MQLTSARLTVDVAEPGVLYHGSRFDWTGFITQVTLDGAHTFCVPEPGDTSTGGAGLCTEFGIFAPIGYDEAGVGETFPKLGVGVLTKPDVAPYSFARPYPLIPYPLAVQREAASATFTMAPLACNGYAARYRKTLTVSENRLTIACTLDNCGEKSLRTHEYCHNFLCIDGHAIGPDYRLHLPYPITFTEQPEIIAVEGQELSWRRVAKEGFYGRPTGFNSRADTGWELRHTPSGVGLCERGDFPLAMLALWGTAEVVSPEMFIDIDLPPGAEMKWSREYTFFIA